MDHAYFGNDDDGKDRHHKQRERHRERERADTRERDNSEHLLRGVRRRRHVARSQYGKAGQLRYTLFRLLFHPEPLPEQESADLLVSAAEPALRHEGAFGRDVMSARPAELARGRPDDAHVAVAGEPARSGAALLL